MHPKQKAFTLLEILLTLVVVSIGFSAVLGMIRGLTDTENENKNLILAARYGQMYYETGSESTFPPEIQAFYNFQRTPGIPFSTLEVSWVENTIPRSILLKGKP